MSFLQSKSFLVFEKYGLLLGMRDNLKLVYFTYKNILCSLCEL